MGRTIENLLSIAKLKTESIQQEKFSTSDIIEHLELVFLNELQESGVEFIKPINDVTLYGYSSHLQQLLQNLISKSIKYRDN